MEIRLLDGGAAAGALNMGTDEAILRAVAAGESPPTLRFYSWAPKCITIGYFQSLEDEVDIEACRFQGVDIVRRLTGGGAVFHDAEITYSVVLPEGHPLAPADILESYRGICAGLVAGLATLGIKALFAPINDIAVDGRKVSGNAQTRKGGCLLQHGTLLLDLNLELMFSLLKIPAEKLKGRLVQDAKARVVSLRSLLGRELPYEEAARALEAGFASAWGQACGAKLKRGSLSPSEAAAGAACAAERFSDPVWNHRR